MPFPFLDAGNTILGKTPKDSYLDDFQNRVNEEFYNASNVFTIEEETSFSSGVYQNVDVRISGVINPTTGTNVESDYKKLTFKDIQHPVNLGGMYRFMDNYWIVINVDRVNTLVNSVAVKRCNNMLRWFDERDGAYYSVPCALGYLINENRDYATAGSAVVTPSGMINCVVQHNSVTDTVIPNQRFLFGNPSNWTAYRVEGGGINNFNNQTTDDNTNSGFVTLSLAVDYVNEDVDDLTNGVANASSNVYVLTVDETSISGGVSQQVQLHTILTYNGDVVNRTLTWSSSDTQVATVSSSGLVTFVATGNATISCQLENNSTVSDTVSVSVVGAPVDTYQVVVSPDTNYVLEESSQTWTVYLYKNNVVQADTFSFVLNSNTIPSDNYTYTAIDGNSFSVDNLEMFLGDTLDVTATSGIYSEIISIYLKGAW
jgi:hypothetical protein